MKITIIIIFKHKIIRVSAKKKKKRCISSFASSLKRDSEVEEQFGISFILLTN